MGSLTCLSPACIKLIQAHTALYTREAMDEAGKLQLGETDIVLCGTAKTGTTWAQQILHGLRSGGDMEFEELSKLIPLIEIVAKFGKNFLSNPSKYSPMIYKSHMRYDLIPKGKAKHIIIVRNPPDSALSLYYFLRGWQFHQDDLSLEEFIDFFFISPNPPYEVQNIGRVINFIAKALPYRHDSRVLWLHYEDLKADLKSCIKLISDFTGIGVGDEQLLELVENQASFDFMFMNKEKYTTGYLKKMAGQNQSNSTNGQDNTFSGGQKVRKGKINEGRKEISQRQLDLFDEQWKKLVQPICGYQSYEEMRIGINKELGRPF